MTTYQLTNYAIKVDQHELPNDNILSDLVEYNSQTQQLVWDVQNIYDLSSGDKNNIEGRLVIGPPGLDQHYVKLYVPYTNADDPNLHTGGDETQINYHRYIQLNEIKRTN